MQAGEFGPVTGIPRCALAAAITRARKRRRASGSRRERTANGFAMSLEEDGRWQSVVLQPRLQLP